MLVHDRVYTDRTIKNAKASIEAQKKLHEKTKAYKFHLLAVHALILWLCGGKYFDVGSRYLSA